MKKLQLFVLPIVIGLFLISCGGAKDGAAGSSESSDGAAVEVSAEMKDFIGSFNGTSDAVAAALEKHGATDEIKKHDMGMYTLAEPQVLSGSNNCYVLKCKSGMVERTYDICWDKQKISSIKEQPVK